jgi:hypothetical protein
MKFLVTGLLAATLGAGVSPLAAEEPKTGLAAIEAIPQLEKRAQKALEHARQIAKRVVSAYTEGGAARGEPLLDEIRHAVELARKSLYETGKDPARKSQPFKKAEIATRRLLRDLDDIEKDLRFDEREYLTKVRTRIAEINEELLMAIMAKKR